MSQRPKKARLDEPDDDYYSDQEIPVHESYGDDFSVSSRSSPHGERDDTESPTLTQDVEMISDSSESFPLTKIKSEISQKRRDRHYRGGRGDQYQSHSEKDSGRTSHKTRYSHSRSPIPLRGSMRDRPLRGESLKRESSSGRNSPMYIDERSRDEHYSRDIETEDIRYRERLSGSSRFLAVREDSRHRDRHGYREHKETYDRSGHQEFKHSTRSSSRGHGERGGNFSQLRDDRRGSLKVLRRPHEHIERSRSSRPDLSSHPSHSSRNIDRNVRRERMREVGKERHRKAHHRHRNRREVIEEEASSAAPVVETVNISSDSAEEGGSGEVPSGGAGGEKIEDLIRDLESGSSSGEISDEESEKEGVSTTEREKERERSHSNSEKDKSSDGEVHSPSPGAKGVMRSRFDSDPDSESGEESRAKDLQLSSLTHKRGFGSYHDTVMSEEEHSGVSETEPAEEDQPGEKESDLSAQLSRELEEVERSPTPVERPCYLPALMGCRNVEENYDYLNKIEEGTYGVVHRAKDKKTGKIFALKRLKLENEKEGFPITSLREIDMLLKAKHPNVVGVREIVLGKNMDRIYIVFEYVEHDLKELMETMKQPFLQGEVKTLMIQLLRAVHHLHDNWIIHRDLKASNLLVSHQAILKVADFGLAREYGSPLRKYTPIVVTLWYRSPELLLGAPEYSTPVDMWSVGCIFAEMMLQKPLFQGKGEIDQLNQIFKLLGTPNEQIWSGYNELPTVKKVSFTNQPYNHLRKKFPPSLLTQNGFDLLNRFLTYDPKKRITAKDALDHPYFKEPPMPIPPSMFNTWPAKSELGHRKKAKSPTPPVGGAFQFAEDGPGFNLKF